MRKRLALAFIIISIALTLSAFSCSNAKQQQVAQAAQNASIVVKGFQQGEIMAFQNGLIPVEDHQFIQRSLITVAQAGKTLDTCIRATSAVAAEITCVNAAVVTLDQLNSQGALYLKSDRAKTDFALAMVGTRTALSTIATILGGS